MIPQDKIKNIIQLSVEQAADFFKTSLSDGLLSSEVLKRRQLYGLNQLKESQGRSPLKIFFEQFQDFIIWVLIGASFVSGFLKEWVDALAIIGIVILNAILGFIQEFRAEKSLAALKKLSSPVTKTIRDRQRNVIASIELVPGDLIELEAGDHIPADCRLVWITANFNVQEASLTGESTPVLKTTIALQDKDLPLADRANMAYMGTFIVSGKAKAIVVDTGMNTELGKIAGMIQGIKDESTPLQRKLEEFGKWMVYLCFLLVGLVFVLEWLRGAKLIDVFLTAVSLAVAAIPEGLPAVVTIALALGVQRMVKKHALIRKLPSVETLGCTTVICSDKTGTLTKNEMTAQVIFAGNETFKISGIGYAAIGEFFLNGKQVDPGKYAQLQKLLQAAVLCNGAELVKAGVGYKIIGDPTEAALLVAAAKAGIWKSEEEKKFVFVDEIPFDSERKKMSILRGYGGQTIAFVKGAPDMLVGDCDYIEDNGVTRRITEVDKENLLKINDQFADQALRVLAVARRNLDGVSSGYQADTVEKGLTFLGLIAMIDPPRQEVKEAVIKCKQAGIKTVMITGDHKNTALAIARELGFLAESSLALSGEELDALSEESLLENIEKIFVYARVTAEHKLRIVKAWRKKGYIVAMTGDGVNDAPAVKEADIGVAMGITGTDVTKEVSDMIITDDNFASIVSAVEEGRGIYENIKKFVHYLLSCNAGEILVMFLSSLIGLPVPLLPIQILWINLVTDGLPALALGVDPVEPGIMRRLPRKTNQPVVTKERAWLILSQGVFIAFCSLLAFSFVLFIEKEGLPRARTAAFIVLACSQLFHSFNCRSIYQSIFKLGIFSNIKLVLATFISFSLLVVAVYLPFAQSIFKTEALGAFDWCLVLAISSFPLWAEEIHKLFIRGRINTRGVSYAGN